MKFFAICGVLAILAFGHDSPVYAQRGRELEAILKDFKSPDQQIRERAYEQIKGDQSALAKPNVRKALLDLLDREEEFDTKRGEEAGEGYIEYVGSLTETVARMANWTDAHDVCILALNAFFPSDFASELAVKGGRLAIPCLLKASHDYPQARSSIVPLLLQIGTVRTDLEPVERQQIVQSAILGLQDSNPGLRLSIALAAKTVGNSALIPALTDIERSDPYSDPTGTQYFPVREAASKAILGIRERTHLN